MKYTITTLTVLVSIFLWSCDTIEGPYMEKPDILPTGDTVETAVIFEFTGWNCPYCYLGHEAIAELESFYAERVNSIGVHAGGFANPGNEGPDFRCDIANELHDKFGNPEAFPAGAINSLNGSDLDTPTAWSSLMTFELVSTKNNPEVYLELEQTYTLNSIQANISGKFAMDLQGSYNLCVLVVEKGIVAPQNKLGAIIEDYEHHNVLRVSMNNGLTGENVALDPKNGKVFEFDYTFEVTDPEWIVDSLEVIPFIYNTETSILLKTMYIKPKTK